MKMIKRFLQAIGLGGGDPREQASAAAERRIVEQAFSQEAYDNHADDVEFLKQLLERKGGKKIEVTIDHRQGLGNFHMPVIMRNVDGEPWMVRGQPKPGRWRLDDLVNQKKGIRDALHEDLTDIDWLLYAIKRQYGPGWRYAITGDAAI